MLRKAFAIQRQTETQRINVELYVLYTKSVEGKFHCVENKGKITIAHTEKEKRVPALK